MVSDPKQVPFDRWLAGDRKALSEGQLRGMALTPDGETLYLAMQTAEHVELWIVRPRAKDSRRLAQLPAGEHELVLERHAGDRHHGHPVRGLHAGLEGLNSGRGRAWWAGARRGV